MKPEPEEIDIATYRRLTAAQPRKRAKKKKRADIPRAPRDEPTGLTNLLREGWCVQTPDCVQYRLYNRAVGDTGLCNSLREACDEAKRLTKEQQG